jgi:hypothetical protein
MVTYIATIPKKISGGEELVVVRRRDFEAFRKWREDVKNILSKVKRGREEYRRKKTVVASSPRQLR